MNLTEQLLTALKKHGARQIFGIPGDFALPYFRIIEESQILPLYTLSHEPGVGFAADASARINGSLGVAAVTYGAGALNMINSVAAAFAEKSPLVVLSGGPGKNESRSGLLLHHQAKTLDSQFQIFKEITCDQVRLDDAERAPADIARVLANCLRHSEPVYIEIPRDMVAVPCLEVVPEAAFKVDPDALDACVDEILERLRAGQITGVDGRRGSAPLRPGGQGRHPVAPLGAAGGDQFHGPRPAGGPGRTLGGHLHGCGRLPGSDAVGGKLGRPVFAGRDHLRHQLCRVRDQDRHAQDHPGAERPGQHRLPHLRQSALAAVVNRMLERVPGPDKAFSVTPQSFPTGLAEDDQSITPTDIATAVNDLMAEHGKMPMASDMGDCLFTAMEISHTALVAPGYYATMGFGVPAGLGLQAATGERPLILVGDGAFQMTGWELGNCKRYGWDPIVLLFNNASWEMLRTFQPESHFNDLGHWGFAEMAAGLGGDGVRVGTRGELKRALDKAVATRGKFQLIEVTIPSGVLSTTLARFVAGVKRLNAVK